MYVVIFEVEIKDGGKEQYLAIASRLKEVLVKMPGFISIERFESLVKEGKILSLSFWESMESIDTWKANLDHMQAQEKGRDSIFKDYRIRVAKIEKDYTMASSSLSGKS